MSEEGNGTTAHELPWTFISPTSLYSKETAKATMVMALLW
jgi:hypothetical protein